jgi:TolB protein
MTRIPTNLSSYCTEPDWNPRDADRIVFTASTGGRTQLALYDFSTGKGYFLTSHSEDCAEAVWLNDGRHLIYTRKEGGRAALWLMDTDTGREQVLSDRRFGDAFSADVTHPVR